MKKAFCLASLCGLGGLLLASCGEAVEGYEDEGVGSVTQDVSKCAGGKLGASNYCSATCKCDFGEGDCDGASECNLPFVCSGDLKQFGAGLAGNACAAAHCNNKRIDGDETQIDCGGSCGTICGDPCAGITANGTAGHCKTDCPCPPLEGDCALNSAKCQMGLVCTFNTGASVGLAASVDLCLGANCSNGMQDGLETGVNCGGTQCLPCSGAAVQSADYGGTGPDHGLGAGADSSGNVVVAGRYAGTSAFGGASLSSNAGSADIFVAKYNSAGAFVKSVSFGSDDADGDNGVSVAVDAAGNSYVAANFYFGHDITIGATTLTSNGLSDIVVFKLDPNLNPLWAKNFGGSMTDRANAISVLGTEVFVAGGFQDTVSFDAISRTSAGNFDAYILKLSGSNGAVSYAATGGGTGADQAFGVGVDNVGIAYFAGSFTGTAAFGTTMLTSIGSTDVFLGRVSSAGAHAWAKGFGGAGADSAQAVVLDSAREPTVVGNFRQTVDFGDAAPVAAVGIDAFGVKYTTAGAFVWKAVVSSTLNDDAASTVLTSGGDITMIGSFQGALDFGSGATTPPAGSRGLYISRYNRTTGALLGGAMYGPPGSARAFGATRSGSTLTVTGDATGAVNFGGAGNLMNLGSTDVFVARFVN